MRRVLEHVGLRQFYGPDGTVEWGKLFLALKLKSEADLKELVYALYLLDWQIAYAVDQRLVEIAAGRLVDPTQLEWKAPSLNPLAWIKADRGCLTCPGSELISYGEFTYPRCACTDQLERYNGCIKYRERLTAANPSEQEMAEWGESILRDLTGALRAYSITTDTPSTDNP